MAKLSENEMAEWENKRDLNAELHERLHGRLKHKKKHLRSPVSACN